MGGELERLGPCISVEGLIFQTECRCMDFTIYKEP